MLYKFVKYRKYFIITTYSHCFPKLGKERGEEREWMDIQIGDGWIHCYFSHNLTLTLLPWWSFVTASTSKSDRNAAIAFQS